MLRQAVVLIKVRAEYDNAKAASGLEVIIPMPRVVQRVSCMFATEPRPAGSQSWDWQEKQRRLVWKFKKVPGATEHTLRVRRTSIPPALSAPVMPVQLLMENSTVEFVARAHGTGTVDDGGWVHGDHPERHRANQLAVPDTDVLRFEAAG